MLDVELPEVQSVDPRAVVLDKVEQVAAMGLPDPVIVEDTGLAIEAWNGLPGALVKWFLGRLGPQGLKDAATAGGGSARATATSAVGVAYEGAWQVWEGRLDGRLVDARGPLGGWTPVFEVGETGLTLGEMDFADRMRHTMRREPLEAALAWLEERR